MIMRIMSRTMVLIIIGPNMYAPYIFIKSLNTILTRIYVEGSAYNHIQTDVEKGITGGKGLLSYHIGILYQFC